MLLLLCCAVALQEVSVLGPYHLLAAPGHLHKHAANTPAGAIAKPSNSKAPTPAPAPAPAAKPSGQTSSSSAARSLAAAAVSYSRKSSSAGAAVDPVWALVQRTKLNPEFPRRYDFPSYQKGWQRTSRQVWLVNSPGNLHCHDFLCCLLSSLTQLGVPVIPLVIPHVWYCTTQTASRTMLPSG